MERHHLNGMCRLEAGVPSSFIRNFGENGFVVSTLEGVSVAKATTTNQAFLFMMVNFV
jgi:hypothetical protein